MKVPVPWGMAGFTRRSTVFLTASTLALIGLFVGLHQPLARRAEAYTDSVSEAWRKLEDRRQRMPTLPALDEAAMDRRIEELTRAVAAVEAAGTETRTRYSMPAETLARIRAGFQLVAFQNERLLRQETLSDLAKEFAVRLDGEVLAGLPAYSFEQSRPELLWAQLTVTHHLVDTALRCGVASIHMIDSLPPQDHRRKGGGPVFLHRIPARIQLSGPFNAVARFLASLPRLQDELAPAGLPAGLKDKTALLIERIRLRKQNPSATDEVALDLQVCGFVFPDRPPAPSPAPDGPDPINGLEVPQ